MMSDPAPPGDDDTRDAPAGVASAATGDVVPTAIAHVAPAGTGEVVEAPPDALLADALRPPRAYGQPLARGRLRVEPEDFLVEELLGFEPSGSGQHVLLKVRKREANTQWVARQLARAGGCRALEVGYAGLKDRHAVAIQWLSLPRSSLALQDWMQVKGEGFEVIEAHEHSRKLPRGALQGNRFTIRIRDMQVADEALSQRLADIAARGVPNYFGPQRFGRDGANLACVSADPRDLKGPRRGFVLSAARSAIFNALAARRVREGSWARLESGDIANLDGRGSIFPVDEPDGELAGRCGRLEIHPTGPLWGRGSPATRGQINALEREVAGRFARHCALVERAGMDQERRALRLSVHELTWHRDPLGIVLAFRLARAGYATTVLREILESDPASEGESDVPE